MAKRLTKDIKESIRREYIGGKTVMELALDYGVCDNTVWLTVRDLKREKPVNRKKEVITREISDGIDESVLIRVKDERKIREEIVGGKKMYDVIDFMFGW